MKKQDKENICQRIMQEGFDYCFVHYSNFEEIKDEKFHQLRLNYVRATKELDEYLGYSKKYG